MTGPEFTSLRVQAHTRAGALYHLTARGNARAKIFLDDADRSLFLDLLGKEIAQQGCRCYAYCLMDNHYHLLIETPVANLVAGGQRRTQSRSWRELVREGDMTARSGRTTWPYYTAAST